MNYKDYIGRDITSLVTLPVWIMEPYTMLQKVAEIMEHTELLDRAAVTEDPYERRASRTLAWDALCTDAAPTSSAAPIPINQYMLPLMCARKTLNWFLLEL